MEYKLDFMPHKFLNVLQQKDIYVEYAEYIQHTKGKFKPYILKFVSNNGESFHIKIWTRRECIYEYSRYYYTNKFCVLLGDLAKLYNPKNDFIKSLIKECIDEFDVNSHQTYSLATKIINMSHLDNIDVAGQLLYYATYHLVLDTTCFEEDVLYFDQPTSFLDIYTKYVKDGEYSYCATPDINRTLYNLNNTERKLLKQYPSNIITNTEYIPETLPVYAVAKLYFTRFDVSRDIRNIDSHIVQKLHDQIEAKRRGKFTHAMKRKEIRIERSKCGCQEHHCPLIKESRIFYKRREYKRDVKYNIKECV